MILLTLAAAAAAQWTGPRTEEYSGPGYFCGGGYAIHLAKGDRALILPQSQSAGVQAARLVLSGREVNIWSGASRAAGPVVVHYGTTAVTQQADGQQVSYTVSDETDFGLLTSNAFRGYSHDGWLFAKANFSRSAEQGVRCLEAYGY